MSNEPYTRPVITPGDKQSPVWGKLMEMWAHDLEKLRNELEACDDDKKAAKLRGRIAEVKANLGLNKDMPIVD